MSSSTACAGWDWIGTKARSAASPAARARATAAPTSKASARRTTGGGSRALLSKGLAYEQDGAIKFKMDRAPIIIPDLVVGDVRRELTDREQADPDFVIVRSDGQPVFHFVNVVDDLEMNVTHVIRGEDHLSNTAKHIALFRALRRRAAQIRAHPAHPEH